MICTPAYLYWSKARIINGGRGCSIEYTAIGVANQILFINWSLASVNTTLKAEILAVCRSGAFMCV